MSTILALVMCVGLIGAPADKGACGALDVPSVEAVVCVEEQAAEAYEAYGVYEEAAVAEAAMPEVVTPEVAIPEAAAPAYGDGDAELLARVICAEAGSTWIPDWVQLYVGSVVLNRVGSAAFPDTIYDVIYQKGQYVPSALYKRDPDERTYANARYLLENGSQIPETVVFQSTVTQGVSVYASYYDSLLGSTTYFCYR